MLAIAFITTLLHLFIQFAKQEYIEDEYEECLGFYGQFNPPEVIFHNLEASTKLEAIQKSDIYNVFS